MKPRHGPLVFSLMILAALLGACGGGTPAAGGGDTPGAGPTILSGTVEVTLQMSAFTPREITIRQGTIVHWTNKDLAGHNVIADDGSFKSDLLANGQSFSHAFDTAGSFPYYCGIHGGPGGAGMSGTIKVVP
jgi:plastocyanin